MVAVAMNGGEKLAGGTSFDVPGHHRGREDHGKQEKLEASSMEGSKGATTAWWRSCARYGRSAHRQNFGEAEREIEGERESVCGTNRSLTSRRCSATRSRWRRDGGTTSPTAEDLWRRAAYGSTATAAQGEVVARV